MAVFMQNTCTFDDCRMTFSTLSDLIYHIEYAHIEHDPIVNEQREASQPSSIPLSYAVRFTSDSGIRNYRDSLVNGEVQCQISQALSSVNNTPTDYNAKHWKSNYTQADQNNLSPTVNSEYSKCRFDVRRCGSEYEEDEGGSPSEDSNDSWTTVEEYSSEFILRYGSRMISSTGGGGGAIDKPFACPVPGCKKRYKNVNGIKYHSKNGHKKDGKIRKSFKCHCGKSYINAKGLKKHSISQHFAKNESPVVVSAAVPAPSAPLLPPPLPHTVHSLVVTCALEPHSLQYDGVGGEVVISNYRRGNAQVISPRSGNVVLTSPAKKGRSRLTQVALPVATLDRHPQALHAPPQLSQ